MRELATRRGSRTGRATEVTGRLQAVLWGRSGMLKGQ